jgi:type II/III secretion system protein
VTRHLPLALIALFALVSSAAVAAQDKPAAPPAAKPSAPAAAVALVKVQVVIGRYQGEKKISSVPYTLAVSTGPVNTTHLRMAAQVPVVSTSFTPNTPGGAAATPLMSYQYKDVGTNIDCSATVTDDGRYLVAMTIDDSSVYPEGEPAKSPTGAPSFRSFRSSETVVLRDGQSTQFVAATDKITGEVVKIDVTVTVSK